MGDNDGMEMQSTATTDLPEWASAVRGSAGPPRIGLSTAMRDRIASGFSLRKRDKKPGRLSKKIKDAEAVKLTKEITDAVNSVARYVPEEMLDKASHLLVPDDEFDDPWLFSPTTEKMVKAAEDTEDEPESRVVKMEETRILLHYLYKPNSSDAWIDREPAVEYNEPPAPRSDPNAVWKVSIRWLRDSIFYKAWMNELDYEHVDTPPKKPMPAKPAPKKAKKPVAAAAYDDDDDDDLGVGGLSDVSDDDGGARKRRRTGAAKVAAIDYGLSSSDESIKSPKSEVSENLYAKSEKDSGSAFEGSNVSEDEESDEDEFEDEDNNASASGSEDRFLPDQSAILRTGARRRVSDDEDDGLMEPVPQCIIKAQESHIELYPVIELIDLDKKIPARLDKMEFEPQMNSVYKNISVTRANWRWVEHLEDAASIVKPIEWPEKLKAARPAWFKQESVTEHEMAAMPTFFLDKNIETPPDGLNFEEMMRTMRHPLKTQEFYIAFRNACVSTYLAHPSEFLSITAVIPLVARASRASCNDQVYQLDLEDIQALHVFFQHAGLINFAVTSWDRFGETVTFSEIREAFEAVAAADRQQQEDYDPPADESLFKIEDADASVLCEDYVYKSLAREKLLLDAGPDKLEDLGKPAAGLVGAELHGDDYACFVCKEKSYNLRFAGIFPYLCTLCANCFSDGVFPSSLSSFHFARVEGPSSVPPSNGREEWSDEEVLALLQGIELHDDNWRRISDYVGSRTVEECIVKFVSLPIGEVPSKLPKQSVEVEDNENETPKPSRDDIDLANPESVPALALDAPNAIDEIVDVMVTSCPENPLMAYLSILANSMNPGIAAAASRAALSRISKRWPDSKCPPEVFAREVKIEMKSNTPKGDERVRDSLLVNAIKASIREVLLCAFAEETRVKKNMPRLLDTQMRLVSAKLQYCMSLLPRPAQPKTNGPEQKVASADPGGSVAGATTSGADAAATSKSAKDEDVDMKEAGDDDEYDAGEADDESE